MAHYLLASHVFPCVTDDHVVLLDLRRDRYVGVGRAQTQVLAGAIVGWPENEAARVAAAGNGAAVVSSGARVERTQ